MEISISSGHKYVEVNVFDITSPQNITLLLPLVERLRLYLCNFKKSTKDVKSRKENPGFPGKKKQEHEK